MRAVNTFNQLKPWNKEHHVVVVVVVVGGGGVGVGVGAGVGVGGGEVVKGVVVVVRPRVNA